MRIIAALLVAMGLSSPLLAAEFIAPKSYPVDRYEQGWQKNPFTLKTAPVAVAKESFAKDLSLAGISSDPGGTTVVLVNTKTREYTRLKNDEPATNGMKVKSVHDADRRSEMSVELELGNETAEVRVDETFLKQVAASRGAPAMPNQQLPSGAVANPTMRPPTPTALPSPVAGRTASQMPATTPPPANRPSAVPGQAGSPIAPQIVAPNIQPSSSPTVQRRRTNNLPQTITPQR